MYLLFIKRKAHLGQPCLQKTISTLPCSHLPDTEFNFSYLWYFPHGLFSTLRQATSYSVFLLKSIKSWVDQDFMKMILRILSDVICLLFEEHRRLINCLVVIDCFSKQAHGILWANHIEQVKQGEPRLNIHKEALWKVLF